MRYVNSESFHQAITDLGECVGDNVGARDALRGIVVYVLSLESALSRAVQPVECGEVAWWDAGHPLAVCTQPYGTEHSHSDLSADQSITAGLARYVTDDDVMVCQHGTTVVRHGK